MYPKTAQHPGICPLAVKRRALLQMLTAGKPGHNTDRAAAGPFLDERHLQQALALNLLFESIPEESDDFDLDYGL